VAELKVAVLEAEQAGPVAAEHMQLPVAERSLQNATAFSPHSTAIINSKKTFTTVYVS